MRSADARAKRHIAAIGRGCPGGVASRVKCLAVLAAGRSGPVARSLQEATMPTTPAPTTAVSLQPPSMSTAQLAAVSFLASYSGTAHGLYQKLVRPRTIRRWSLVEVLKVSGCRFRS